MSRVCGGRWFSPARWRVKYLDAPPHTQHMILEIFGRVSLQSMGQGYLNLLF